MFCIIIVVDKIIISFGNTCFYFYFIHIWKIQGKAIAMCTSFWEHNFVF